MARSLSELMLAAIQADSLCPVYLADVETTGGTVRVWTGLGTLSANGRDYSGVGNFGGITASPEATDLSATSIQMTLSGVPSSMLAIALGQIEVGNEATLYFGVLDRQTNALIDDPVIMYRGFTDVPTISDGADTATISVSVENRLRTLEHPKIRMYTPVDHQIEYPGDLGFNFVASIQDKVITWK